MYLRARDGGGCSGEGAPEAGSADFWESHAREEIEVGPRLLERFIRDDSVGNVRGKLDRSSATLALGRSQGEGFPTSN